MLLVTLCIGASNAAAADHVALESWRHAAAVAFEDRLTAVGDFNRDGRDELVLVQNSRFFESRDGGSVVSTVGRSNSDAWQILDSQSIAGRFYDAASVRDAHGGHVLVALHNHMVNFSYPLGVELAIFSGAPVGLLRRLPSTLTRNDEILGGADVDGDGDPEAIVTSGFPYGIAAIDLRDGIVKWSVATAERVRSVAIAQLDTDTALEVVVSGPDGMVVDGATGVRDWSYPLGFGSDVVVGDFDPASAGTEFAVSSFSRRRIDFYRGTPFSPMFDTPLTNAPHATAMGDFTEADGDELALVGIDRVAILEPRGGEIHAWSQPGMAFVTPGRFDAGRDKLVVAIEPTQESLARVMVVEPDGALVHAMPAHEGITPFALAIGDIDGDGTNEIVYLLPGEASGTIEVRVLDRDGRVHDAALLVTPGAPLKDLKIALAQLDADAPLEVLVGGTAETSEHGKVLAYDSATWTLQWSTGDAMPRRFTRISALEAGAVDALGNDRLFVATDEVRLTEIDAISGADVWQSDVKEWSNWIDVQLFDTDADGLNEILLTSGPDVYAYDAATRQQEWQHYTDVTVNRGHRFYAVDGECRFATLSRAGSLVEFACEHGTLTRQMYSERPYDWLATFPSSDPANPLLLALSNGVMVQLNLDARREQPISGYLTPAAGYEGDGVAFLDESGSSLVIAAGLTVRRLDIKPTRLFANDFE